MLIATAVLIGTLIPTKTLGDRSEALVIQTPLDVLTDTSSKDEIIEAIRYTAQKYLIDESQLMTVINCESSYKTTAIGDSGLAYGLLQFHRPTFDRFCVGDYYSAKDQLNCAGKMWQTPRLKLHWSCFKKFFTS